MNTENNENNKILYLEKQGEEWCMDKNTFKAFMQHVTGYFKMTIPCVIDYAKVESASLTYFNLMIVCVIYGTHASGENTLLLVPVYPTTFVMPWEESFVLKVNSTDGKKLHSQLYTMTLSFYDSVSQYKREPNQQQTNNITNQ